MEYRTPAKSEAKRRKIRKGTKSCWECKKRKMKCVYADSSSPSDAEAICIGCQQRGSKCVSQEFEFVGGRENAGNVESKGRQHAKSKDKHRVARVEALVEQLIKKVDSHGGFGVSTTGEIPTPGSSHGIPTASASIDQEPSSRFLPSDVSVSSRISIYNETFTYYHFIRITAQLNLRGDMKNYVEDCTDPCPRDK